MTKKRFLSYHEQAAIEAERIERARAVKARAKFLLIGPPRLNPKPDPDPDPDHFQVHYTGLTWQGHKIIIRKGKYGW
jgi:hypothetical protein